MKIFVVKTDYGLLPAGPSDHDILGKFAKGDIMEVNIRKARNYMFHRKFFALLKVGFEAQNSFDSFDWYREWLLMKAGHFEHCKSPKGTDLYRAKSLSFDKMDNLEFEQVFRDVSDTIIKVHKITAEQISENLSLFI